MKDLKELLAELAEGAAEDAREAFYERLEDHEGQWESPIEHLFLAGCIETFGKPWFPFEFEILPKPYPWLPINVPEEYADLRSVCLIPQCRVGTYRVDFMFSIISNRKVRGLVVECDGHEFHERTKEQARRDKRRDREMLGMDLPVMRFTGSEIWADVRAALSKSSR